MKKIIERIFKKLGYSIHRSIPKAPAYSVDQVVDVGVALGTDSLLQNYPKAKFFLVEPNPEYFTFIENKICKKYNALLIKYGASDKIGKVNFKLDKLNSEITNGKSKDTAEIYISTLDDILLNNVAFDMNSKTLIKIDTEGHELAVLRGAIGLLREARIEYICLELRISGVSDSYNPTDIFVFLNENNYCFERIDKIAFRGSRISYMDVTFKKVDKLN